MRRRTMLLGTPLLLATASSSAAPPPIGLRTDLGTWTDDFDGLMKRRVIRILAPYSRTLFFEDRGTFYGTVAENARVLEIWLNKTFKTGSRPIVVAVIPTTRDQLLGDLLAGRGDIGAGDITVSAGLAKEVAFTDPLLRGVKEILATNAKTPRFTNADALSGTEVATRKGTSSFNSLQALNQDLTAVGKPPVKLVLVPGALENEDMMDMVASELLPPIVVDDWIVRLWAGLIPGLTAQSQVVLREGVDLSWGVRLSNPKLLQVLNEAIDQGNHVENFSNRLKFYLGKLKRLHAATSGEDLRRFQTLRELFERYGKEYDFDDLLLQAQSFQESRLRQETRSHAGAVGLMQLLPQTGASMKVGDINQAGPNVHAGAKYMRELIGKYFPDAQFDEQNRTLFAFASYNAGPAAIARMRKLAAAQGLQQDVWFNNVERVTAAHIGQEPVRYVRNIYKYYVAYKLVEEHEHTAEAARKRVPKSP
jgi:membrane-bound lytic murein transglycosylase MltF